MSEDERLFSYLRELLARHHNQEFDKKQLRFNEIVLCAKTFYNNPMEGVKELVESCMTHTTLYVRKNPMWYELTANHGWMLQLKKD